MKINRNDLREAVAKGIIDDAQAARLWQFLDARGLDTPGFRFTHILYYLGGLVAIGAMTLFMNLGWEQFGGSGIFFLSLFYCALGLWLTNYFLKRNLGVPAGIMATFAVALVPLAIYGLQEALGYWDESLPYRDFHVYIDWRWILMELGTLAAGVLLFARYRFPFMLMPIAVTLWYMSMDVVPFVFGDADHDWDLRKRVSLYFGLAMTLLAFWIDLRSRRSGRDFAFWIYLFGVLTFWGGMSLMDSRSEFGGFVYLCINLLLIVTGAMLSRRVFVVFGALGVAIYLGHLAYDVFKDSMLFPVALSAIGLGVIWLGILWQKHETALQARMRGWLPQPLQELLESRD